MAQQYGLGNFVYEIEVSDGKANFVFRDPEDASNTAEVSVAEADFPGGVKADSRLVADLAFDQCQRVLNEKRDARIAQQASDDLAAKQEEDARSRQAAQDFLESSEDVAVAPASVEKDGTTVYNTENIPDADGKLPSESSSSSNTSSSDSKKK